MKDTLDSLILSSVSDRWQKVAKIMALVSERHSSTADFSAIEARIRVLTEDGKLEAKGDLSQWRFSEVRRTS
jgi:hypothetical protein